MLPAYLVKKFPKLKADGAKKTSEATKQYNCIAWSAARDKHQWWQPIKIESWDYWPPDLPPGDCSFQNFIQLFENQGYRQCSGSHFEILYKKVAIYATANTDPLDKENWDFSHVCDQLNSGAWTSKLGGYEDIQHNTLEALAGIAEEEYGEIVVLLKRRCSLFDVLARIFFCIFPRQ